MKKLLCLLCFWPGLALAAVQAPMADPDVEKRLQALAGELRCLVCQNQSLADSEADLAKDLKREIRVMIRAGRSDGEIVDFLAARYGNFVRYRPPLAGVALPLWGGPGLFLIVGIVVLARQIRLRRIAGTPSPEASREPRSAPHRPTER